MIAAVNGDLEVVKTLLEYGANVNAKEEEFGLSKFKIMNHQFYI